MDASSFLVQVGILSDDKWLGYFRSEEPALQSLFQGIEVCLQMAGLELRAVTDFAYCEGPGSLLGIRLAAMAIRAWKKQEVFRNAGVYSYNSFAYALQLIKKSHVSQEPYAIVSESRKGYWNILKSGDGNQQVFEVDDTELSSSLGQLWLFKQRKIPSAAQGFRTMAFDYNLKECPEIFAQSGLMRSVEEPDSLFVREPEYAKWDSKRHGMEAQK